MRWLPGLLKFAVITLIFYAFSHEAKAELALVGPEVDSKGPARAKGVIIWNQEQAKPSESNPTVPLYFQNLREAGWDIYKLVRMLPEENEVGTVQMLAAESKRLRTIGYKQVISAGQGYGAWLSIMAASDPAQSFDAVIAIAPQAFGEMGKSNNWTKNAEHLYPLVQNMKPVPVFLALFANDNFDPGGRGKELSAILDKKHQPYALLDRPADLTGHAAGNSSFFAREYGSCITDFLKSASLIKGRYDCPSKEKRQELEAFVLPADLAPPPKGTGFVGRWVGMLENKRPVLIQVDSLEGGTAKNALYAWGAIGGAPGNIRLDGTMVGDQLVMKNERIKIEMHPLDADQIQIRWMRIDGRFLVVGRLQRSK